MLLNRTVDPPFVACVQCGISFQPTWDSISRGRGKFCSRACRNKARAIPAEVRFWNQVAVAGPNDCWIWTGSVRGMGYGRLTINAKSVPAHRFSWELKFGPIPDGLFVCHNCPSGDNPRCVNPAHLFLGTALDNNRDTFAKNRNIQGDEHWTRKHPEARLNGERNAQAKLTNEQVIEIRALHALGGVSQMELARSFDVSDVLIGKIVRGLAWTHI